MRLNEFDIYDKSNPKRNNVFLESLDSNLDVKIDINKVEINGDWIEILEEYIPHVQKAIDNPNKQIVTEQEIVKIELIKKVTVDSIKHLAKNTNLISDVDKKTGDVIPAKILNSFKEESFITYENRFIYSLVLRLGDFLTLKKRNLNQILSNKNKRSLEYTGNTIINNERIKIKSELSLEQLNSRTKKLEEIEKEIQSIQKKLDLLESTEIFKLMESNNVLVVKPPLKMTNVLLKNIDFQYAVKLWNYLAKTLDTKSKVVKEKKNYQEKGILKDLTDENFLLSYLNCDLLKSENELDQEYVIDKDELIKKITKELITRILNLNPDLTEMQLNNIIAEKYAELKKVNQLNLKKLEEIYRNNIDLYMQKIDKKRIN